jgi:mannose-6-phosphate isomerase
MEKPIRLTPSLREKVWGKTCLAPWFPDSERPIGEAWFLGGAGPRGHPATGVLPLLVKLIFTSERLSVQVHPDDGEDGPRGKTEMWYILDAEPGAAIALGFRQPITRQRLLESTRTGEIERLINWFPVKSGETYFTPAHTVHAIGGGIVLCEIQQNSDVTYRLWDYGRPRELHVGKAVAIADLGVHPGAVRARPISEGRDELVRCRHFVTELVWLTPGAPHTPTPEPCQIWICVEGRGAIEGEPFQPGEAWLFPEAGEQPALRAETNARLLRTYVPR